MECGLAVSRVYCGDVVQYIRETTLSYLVRHLMKPSARMQNSVWNGCSLVVLAEPTHLHATVQGCGNERQRATHQAASRQEGVFLLPFTALAAAVLEDSTAKLIETSRLT
jgi:hypothetical protein